MATGTSPTGSNPPNPLKKVQSISDSRIKGYFSKRVTLWTWRASVFCIRRLLSVLYPPNPAFSHEVAEVPKLKVAYDPGKEKRNVVVFHGRQRV